MSDEHGVGTSSKEKRSSTTPQDADKASASKGQTGGKNWKQDEDVLQAESGDIRDGKGHYKSGK